MTIYEDVANGIDLGQATAVKRGRDPRWPYVPVIDHGTYTSQVRGLAFATRAEAIEAAAAHIEANRTNIAVMLAQPRHRALREQYGLPREIEPS